MTILMMLFTLGLSDKDKTESNESTNLDDDDVDVDVGHFTCNVASLLGIVSFMSHVRYLNTVSTV